MQYARLLRANVLVERTKEYIQATISVGAGSGRILRRHLLPNATRGVFVLVASDIGAMMTLVAVLNFIGLAGGASGDMIADWGQMLSAARDWIIGTPANAFEYWYVYLPPSLAIICFSMGWSLVGDGLRVAMDPRTGRGASAGAPNRTTH